MFQRNVLPPFSIHLNQFIFLEDEDGMLLQNVRTFNQYIVQKPIRRMSFEDQCGSLLCVVTSYDCCTYLRNAALLILLRTGRYKTTLLVRFEVLTVVLLKIQVCH